MKRDSFWFLNNFPNEQRNRCANEFSHDKSELQASQMFGSRPRTSRPRNLAATKHKTRRIKVGCSHFFHIVNGCEGSQGERNQVNDAFINSILFPFGEVSNHGDLET